MKKYQEEGNYNARIGIDYNDKKPKVSFSYPNKKLQFNGSGYSTAKEIWWIIFFIGLFLWIIFGNTHFIHSDFYDFSNYTNCVIANQSIYLSTDYTYFVNHTCAERVYPFEINKLVIFLLVFFCGWFFMPIILYFPFKKKWDNFYPEWQQITSRKKLRIFKKEDVREPTEKGFKYKYFVELPVFTNVILDFKATKDFSKFMKYFEIREYKFNYLSKKKIRIGKKKLFGKGKYRKYKKVNEWIWYSRWYFSEKPETGQLKVLFK
jgi:hypothetical protein